MNRVLTRSHVLHSYPLVSKSLHGVWWDKISSLVCSLILTRFPFLVDLCLPARVCIFGFLSLFSLVFDILHMENRWARTQSSHVAQIPNVMIFRKVKYQIDHSVFFIIVPSEFGLYYLIYVSHRFQFLFFSWDISFFTQFPVNLYFFQVSFCCILLKIYTKSWA